MEVASGDDDWSDTICEVQRDQLVLPEDTDDEAKKAILAQAVLAILWAAGVVKANSRCGYENSVFVAWGIPTKMKHQHPSPPRQSYPLPRLAETARGRRCALPICCELVLSGCLDFEQFVWRLEYLDPKELH